jgi:RNA polymerase sigma-70 factor (ECF subfamily)
MDDSSLSDEQLAAVIARREQSAPAWRAAQNACQELYQRHARRLLAFLAARVKRSHLEDLHQDIWQRVWQHVAGGFHGGNFRAWLYMIARNCVTDQGRKKQLSPLGETQDLPDVRQRPAEAALVDVELTALLHRCLQRVATEAASVVQARLAGESYQDICQRTGLKPETAHKLFHQAKAQLQACVQRATA